MALNESEKVGLRLIPILGNLAMKQETISYKEIGEFVGKHPRALSHPLAFVRLICERHNLPRLDVLVVHTGDGLPGDSFIEGGREGLDDDSYRLVTDELRSEVFNYSRWAEVIPRLAKHYGES